MEGRPDQDEEDDGWSFIHHQGLKCPKAKNMERSGRQLRYQEVFGLQAQIVFGMLNSFPKLLAHSK